MTPSNLFGSLCIRADAGYFMGIGHVMRCLALAQAWRDLGGNVCLITCSLSDALRNRMDHEGVATTLLNADPAGPDDLQQTTSIVRAEGASWLVLDGYHFDKDYRERIKAAGLRLLVVDDLADTDLRDADIVLNQNAYADPAMYAGCAPQANLLLGADHALLRREFQSFRTQRPAAARAVNIIVTLGGADPGNVTQRVMEALAAFTTWRLHVTVVAGAANQHLESLRDLLPALQRQHDAELVVNPSDLPERMNRADLAITAAGSTCWELAYLGVPMLATVTADNQVRVAGKLANLGIAEIIQHDAAIPAWLEKFGSLAGSQEQRHIMSQNSRALVDGRGARRVVEALAAHPVTLRAAAESDSRQLWEWANDPETRRVSFSPEPIPWDHHARWLARVLRDAERRLFIAQCERQDIGQLRFDRENREATMSVALAPKWRGRGLGPRVVRHGATRMLLDSWVDSVLALVKRGNEASNRTFERAGFEPVESSVPQGQEPLAWRMRL